MMLTLLRYGQLRRVMVALMLLLASPCYAVDVNFSGTLIAPPLCTINNQDLFVVFIDGVLFEDLVETNNDILSSTYKYNIELPLDCTDTDTYSLTMTLKGDPAPFDSRYLDGKVPGYGIAFLFNGAPLSINSELAIDPSSPAVLTLIPVRVPGATISNVQFVSQSAYIVLNYYF